MIYEIGKKYDVTDYMKKVDSWYDGSRLIITCESITDGNMNVKDNFIMWSLENLKNGLIKCL